MSYTSEVMADSPVAYYLLDEAAGLVQDSSGNANHATSVNGSPTYQETGPIISDATNYAMTFNGSSGNIYIDDDDTLDVGDTFTIEAWIKRSATGLVGGRGIVVKYDGGGGMWVRNTDNLAIGKSNIGYIANSTTTITDTTTWHHCVVSKSGATSHIYLDGQDVTGTVTDLTCVVGTGPLTIGSESGGAYFPGSIARPAMYPTALSITRIQAHFAAAQETVISEPGIAFLSGVGW